ncbi:MAG: hypothetical protein QXT39_06800, partial [Conexivisphaerales archaeon]
IAKEKMPDGAPPEVIVFLLRGMKAALYYREKAEKKKAAPTNTAGEKEQVQAILEGLEWKNAKDSRQWTFITNKDGSIVDALKPLESTLEKIKEARGTAVIGKWRYSISNGGKFLSRYPV